MGTKAKDALIEQLLKKVEEKKKQIDKVYQEENKEEIRVQRRKFREEHKEEIKFEKIFCDSSSTICLSHSFGIIGIITTCIEAIFGGKTNPLSS